MLYTAVRTQCQGESLFSGCHQLYNTETSNTRQIIGLPNKQNLRILF